jgi:hypothetical protein
MGRRNSSPSFLLFVGGTIALQTPFNYQLSSLPAS